MKGLAGVPSEGPVLLVGYHNLMGLELYPLVEEFLRQKSIVVRGVAHPQLFVADSNSSPEFSMNDWFRVFGALPVTPSNLFKLLSSKSHVLLYPGGAREALHYKVSSYFNLSIFPWLTIPDSLDYLLASVSFSNLLHL